MKKEHPEVKQEQQSTNADDYFSNFNGEVFIEPAKLNYAPQFNQFVPATNQQAIYPPRYNNTYPQHTSTIKSQSYMVWSVFNCLFCCILLGIPALICSCQARGHFDRGEQADGAESAKCAKIFNIAACVFGIIDIFIYLVLSAKGVV